MPRQRGGARRAVGVASERAAVQLDVGTGDIQLDRRDFATAFEHLHSPAVAGGRFGGDAGDDRHRQLRKPRQVLLDKALDPLVGEPDGIEQAGRRFIQARRQVAGPGLEGDGLGNVGGKGKIAEEVGFQDVIGR